MLPLNWLQTNGRMEKGGEKLSTQESRLLTPELGPTLRVINKSHILQGNRVCGIGMSVLCVCRSCSSPGLEFCMLGTLKNINVLPECLCRQAFVAEVLPRTQEKV